MSVDRSTGELIEVLGSDFDYFFDEVASRIKEKEKAPERLSEADFQFEARQLVRTAFAYIEAVTFSIKLRSAIECEEKNIPLSYAESCLVAEIQHNLNDKGEVVERPAQIRLAQNVIFAFNLLAKSKNIDPFFDSSRKWWSCFKKAIKIRDRLMHPRMPGDLDISVDELTDIMESKLGFDEVLLDHI